MEIAMLIHVCGVFSCFCTATVQNLVVAKDFMSYKAENVYSLALCRKSLPNPDIQPLMRDNRGQKEHLHPEFICFPKKKFRECPDLSFWPTVTP